MFAIAYIDPEGGVHIDGRSTVIWHGDHDGWIAAATGEGRYQQLCRKLEWPSPQSTGVTGSGTDEGDSVREYVDKVVDAVIDTLKAGDCADRKEGRVRAKGRVLITNRNRIFVIEEDFEVKEYDRMAGIGAKAPFALGVLTAFETFDLNLGHRERFENAIGCASESGTPVSPTTPLHLNGKAGP